MDIRTRTYHALLGPAQPGAGVVLLLVGLVRTLRVANLGLVRVENKTNTKTKTQPKKKERRRGRKKRKRRGLAVSNVDQ